MKLSERSVKNLKPKDKRYAVMENGLVLEVNPSGKKVFFYKFRQDGVQHKPKLGEYPSLSVADAKKLVLNKKHDIQIKGIKQPILEVTFKEFVEGEYKVWLFANNKAAGDSYKTIETHFMSLLGHLKIKSIEPRIIEAWKSKRLNSGTSPATVSRNLTELRSIFSRIEDWFKLPSIMPSVKNPRITVEKEKLYLSDDEMQKLRAMCDKYVYLHHFGAREDIPTNWGIQSITKIPIILPYIIHVAVNTGMRKGEILQLRLSDIDHASESITVRGSTEKTGRSRDIPISNKLQALLAEWATLHYGDGYDLDSDDLVFPIGDIKTGWNTLRKRAGLGRVEFKTLRHHFASTLVLNNTPLSTVMQLMGHTNLKTTQRYLSVRTEDKIEAVNLL